MATRSRKWDKPYGLVVDTLFEIRKAMRALRRAEHRLKAELRLQAREALKARQAP